MTAVPPDALGFADQYAAGAVADLNDDGTMEIAVSGGSWESSWITIFELQGDRFEPVLNSGCGV